MENKNVLSCLLKDGKEVNAVMLVGRLFHARATVTQNVNACVSCSMVLCVLAVLWWSTTQSDR